MVKVPKRYITCWRCGQVGGTLVKIDDEHYACADVQWCEHRQALSKAINAPLCGHLGCREKAEYECSCGVLLCEKHSESTIHMWHVVTPLEGV